MAPARHAHADPAAAEALFQEGRRLLDAGEYAEACARLAESQAQDPASGTLINLALCYEKRGLLASAWAQYRLAASLARQDARPERVRSAEQKADELEARVPRLTLLAPHPVPGMVASWGSNRVGAGAFGSPIPLDPGPYVVTVSAPGYLEQTQSFELHEAESRTLELPALEPTLPTTSGAPLAPRPAPPDAPVTRRRVAPVPPPRGAPVAAYVAGGTGVASLALGAFFGVKSLSSYARADRACPGHHACPASSREPRQDAETEAWIANVALGAGVIACGVGGWLLYSSQSATGGTSLGVSPLASGAALTLIGTM